MYSESKLRYSKILKVRVEKRLHAIISNMTEEVTKSKPLIIAHRGASALAPENTMAAFELAIKQGARAFELDTMLTSDGIPVVIHDHTLDRTTNGTGSVNQKKYDECEYFLVHRERSSITASMRPSTLHWILQEPRGMLFYSCLRSSCFKCGFQKFDRFLSCGGKKCLARSAFRRVKAEL